MGLSITQAIIACLPLGSTNLAGIVLVEVERMTPNPARCIGDYVEPSTRKVRRSEHGGGCSGRWGKCDPEAKMVAVLA